MLRSNVQYGMTNSDVTTLQQALIAEGFSIPAGATGYFGDQTKAAYTSFQESLGYTSSGGTLNSPTFGAISKSSVVYTFNSGITNSESTFQSYAYQACDKTGVPSTWVTGVSNGCNLTTLALRESSYNDNAVNNSDSNATGPTVSDGNPENCSRGYCQTIPDTFSSYHEENTSNHIYDPVANIAAAINYIRAVYGDISNVQQANPNMSPHPY